MRRDEEDRRGGDEEEMKMEMMRADGEVKSEGLFILFIIYFIICEL